MPRNKKRFDKKNATHFHIVHRSQRDVTEDEHGHRSEFVLVQENNSVPGNEKESKYDNLMGSLKDEFQEMNILADDETYDYSQHYRHMGSGDFLSAHTGKIADQSTDERAKDIPVEQTTTEVERMLESINLNPKYMDQEIRDALFNFEEEEFEEILDDFCLTAAQEPNNNENTEAFDYDDHIRKLMEKAKAAENGGVSGKGREYKDDFFTSMKPINEEDDDSQVDSWDQEMTTVSLYHNPQSDPDQEKAILEKFEQTLAEYDSDDVGDLYTKEEDIANDCALDVFGDGNSAINNILDDYLECRNDEKLMEGSNQTRHGGSGYSILVKGKMVRADEIDTDNDEKDEDSSIENVELMAELEPPAEEVLIDGKSYFTERTINPWDCESILSTYSTLDNNPAVIGSSRRRKKKKQSGRNKSELVVSENNSTILLSRKTGLPLGVLPVTEKSSKKRTELPKKQVERRRGESREERKLRKEAVKRSKQEARMQKKIMRGVFADESSKRLASSCGDDVAGLPVFRYS